MQQAQQAGSRCGTVPTHYMLTLQRKSGSKCSTVPTHYMLTL
jgi:hypothetical protein